LPKAIFLTYFNDLTFDHVIPNSPKLIISCLCTVDRLCHLHQNRFIPFQNIVFTILVTDKCTNKQTEEWICQQHNASACQSGLAKA